MRGKPPLAAGIAAGYVLGARVGPSGYDQIANAAKKFAAFPKVQQTASQLSQQATDTVSKVSSTVGAKVGDRIPERLKTGSSSGDYPAGTTKRAHRVPVRGTRATAPRRLDDASARRGRLRSAVPEDQGFLTPPTLHSRTAGSAGAAGNAASR